MTNDEIQALAVELSSLDPLMDAARIQTMRNRIADYEVSLIREGSDGKAYFPLLKRFNGQVAYKDFWGVFTEVLMELFNVYDPSKGAAFISMLRNLLDLRLRDVFKKYAEESVSHIPIGNYDEDGDGETTETFKDIPDPNSSIDTVMLHWLDIAALITDTKRQEEHLPARRRSYFDGFFTFDTAKLTKDGVLPSDEVINENKTLFPLMVITILEYLMFGTFSHMRDVVLNDLRDETLLEKRGEVIETCCGMSHPTQVDRNKRYRQLVADEA
jgi:hypothetical protein